jgi:hypothetical protein
MTQSVAYALELGLKIATQKTSFEVRDVPGLDSGETLIHHQAAEAVELNSHRCNSYS